MGNSEDSQGTHSALVNATHHTEEAGVGLGRDLMTVSLQEKDVQTIRDRGMLQISDNWKKGCLPAPTSPSTPETQ